ncbi:MAG: sodium/proline symporter PutP [Candidatus Zixiibacteriota bacterium]
MSDPVLIGFVVYLIVVLVVGSLTLRLTKSLADYLLAGRSLGPWLVAFSERASGESAWLLIGLPGVALLAGFGAIWPAIGCTFGIFVSWTLVARKLREQTESHNAITLPQFLENRFNDDTHSLRWVATIIIVFFFTLYVAAQFLGAGKVLNAAFGMTPLQGMLLGSVIILFYTIMGGFYAVVWTDFFQGLIMIFTLGVLPIAGLIAVGGLGPLTEKLSAVNPNLLRLGGESSTSLLDTIVYAIGGLGIGLGYVGQPHLLARFMSIRKAGDLRKGSLIATFWALIAFYGAVGVGLVGIAMLGQGLDDPEQVMPLLARTLMPGAIVGVMISGAIAAMMSTADSQLLVTTSAVTEDIYHGLINKDAPQKRLVLISRLVTVAVGVIALILALTGEELVYDLVLYAWGGLGAAFGPAILFTLWSKRVTKNAVLAGMITGAVSVIVWKNIPVLSGFLYELVPGFLLATVVIWVMSRR